MCMYVKKALRRNMRTKRGVSRAVRFSLSIVAARVAAVAAAAVITAQLPNTAINRRDVFEISFPALLHSTEKLEFLRVNKIFFRFTEKLDKREKNKEFKIEQLNICYYLNKYHQGGQ